MPYRGKKKKVFQVKIDIMCWQNVKIQLVINMYYEIKNIEQQSEFGKGFERHSDKTEQQIFSLCGVSYKMNFL